MTRAEPGALVLLMTARPTSHAPSTSRRSTRSWATRSDRTHALGKAKRRCPAHLAMSTEWLSPFDEHRSPSSGSCMRATGQHRPALGRRARRCLQTPSGPKSCVGQILVAQLLVERRDVDGACDVGRAVISSTSAPGSARVIALLDELRLALVPYKSSRVVFEFLTLLSQEQQSRRWLMSGLDVPDDEERARNHADPSGHDAG